MLFIDEQSRIDKEALRNFAFSELSRFEEKVEVLVFGQDNKQFWESLHNLIAVYDGPEKMSYRKVEKQIENLKSYITGWKETSVSSEERFEFFVQTKASEIKSGDQMRDYFWALQIRHDQLVALVTVIGRLINQIEIWVKMKTSEVLDDPIYVGLGEYSLEDQVYLEAANIHKKRKKMTE